MGRVEAIARSVVRVIVKGARKRSRSPVAFILALLSTIFSFYELPLHKHRAEVFADLRQKYWKVEEDDYVASFRADEGAPPESALTTLGDLALSGSTFFSTLDQKFLVKSVPRHHEYTFFRNDLLDAYAAHMAAHPKSLLVRICDFLASSGMAMGHQLGLAPSHHIVMENILYGKDEAKRKGQRAWETWDLKPTSYFYPERDIADGRLTSEATKDQLSDEFDGKIMLSRENADEFRRILEADTRLLTHYNAVDYSLFLVRIEPDAPAEEVSGPPSSSPAPPESEDLVPHAPPAVPPEPPSWRTGVPSADGKYLYRIAILDFFWAKHKAQPRIMTFLVNTYNTLIHRHGPMSITTTPEEYRERFLAYIQDMIEVRDNEVES